MWENSRTERHQAGAAGAWGKASTGPQGAQWVSGRSTEVRRLGRGGLAGRVATQEWLCPVWDTLACPMEVCVALSSGQRSSQLGTSGERPGAGVGGSPSGRVGKGRTEPACGHLQNFPEGAG